MRHLKLITLTFLGAGFLLILATGCKKGDTGATGPAGPDSVQYSNWITLNMDYIGTDTVDNSDVYSQTITAASITSTVLNKGSVIGYMLVSDPITGDSSVINASLALQEFFGVGKINLLSYNSDYSGYSYRYVIIPANVTTTDASGKAKTYTSKQLTGLDYKSLTKILGIPAKGATLKTD